MEERTEQITVYLTKEDAKRLWLIARRYGLTSSAAARMMIKYCLDEVPFFSPEKFQDPAVLELRRLLSGEKKREEGEEG